MHLVAMQALLRVMPNFMERIGSQTEHCHRDEKNPLKATLQKPQQEIVVLQRLERSGKHSMRYLLHTSRMAKHSPIRSNDFFDS